MFNSVILIFTDKIIKSFIVFELELLITWVRINIFNRSLRKDIKKIRKEENSIFKHSLLGYLERGSLFVNYIVELSLKYIVDLSVNCRFEVSLKYLWGVFEVSDGDGCD